ncbi:hypothetical protein AFLA70_213g001511 [Aspergillus flavus AF70]|nr:hypothetical protein AFLA70_213g001511 [Aspergillus flavus AF70]
MSNDLFEFDPPSYRMADTNPHLPENKKRKSESSLERNRQAAKRCRKKKKECTDQLEEHFQNAKLRKEILEAEVSQMQSEILFLKDILLRHSQCGGDNIKTYLSHMLTRLAGRLAPTLRGDICIEESSMLLMCHSPVGEQRLSVDSSASSEVSTTFLDAVEQVDWGSTASTIDHNQSNLAGDPYWDSFIDFS